MSGAARTLREARMARMARIARMAETPGWLVALGVWLTARAVTALVTASVARTQPENLWTPAAPGYLDFVGIWDGRWYQEIAEDGYPRPLPVGPDGRPGQSAWAFFPAYPLLVRLVMTGTGLPWRVTAPVVSLVLGCAVAVVAYRLFRLRAPHDAALGGVAVLAVFPSTPVLQYAYADVLSLLALLGALHLVSTRRYLWCVVPVAALGLSRPVGLPFAAVVLVHLLVRLHGRRGDPFPPTQQVAVVALAAASLAAALAFPVAVALATGRADGYPAVQDAWRAGEGVRYFAPWWSMARYLAGERTGAVALAALALAALALTTAGLLARRQARALGPEAWVWCAAYALYLAAVVEPYSSVIRQLLLFAPGAVAVSAGLLRGSRGRGRGRLALAAWLVGSLAMQVVWIEELWHLAPPTDPPP